MPVSESASLLRAILQSAYYVTLFKAARERGAPEVLQGVAGMMH